MPDYFHKPPRGTIYVQTDNFSGMDLGLQFALARSMLYGNDHPYRYDLPPQPLYQWNRHPLASPLTLATPRFQNNPSTHAGPLGVLPTGIKFGKG